MSYPLKGINYSIDPSNFGSWKKLLFSLDDRIKEDFLFIRDRLQCDNIALKKL